MPKKEWGYGEYSGPKKEKQEKEPKEERSTPKTTPKAAAGPPPTPEVTKWKCIFSLPGNMIGVLLDTSLPIGSSPVARVAYIDRAACCDGSSAEAVSPRWRIYHPQYAAIDSIESYCNTADPCPSTSDPNTRVEFIEL